MQIATHKNVVQSYHFDFVKISEGEYFIIVMKYYEGTLSSIGNISSESVESKSAKGWKLFTNLSIALQYLHKNHIIHRDVKPQNIFFDGTCKEFVLGDLGIAHFSKVAFPKEARTKPGERLANHSYSPHEQIDSSNPIKETNDIFALGQVLEWYLTGQVVRGLDRPPISDANSPNELKWLDSIIDKCIKNNPNSRFQSIDEIYSFIAEQKKPPKIDYWKILHNFDDVIRRTFPKINGIASISDKNQMAAFFDNFRDQCASDDFWYMTMEGGDNTYEHLRPIENGRLLFCEYVELDINKLIVFRDQNVYRNFFVLLTMPSQPFEIVDSHGTLLKRDISKEWPTDIAVRWNNTYIDLKEILNGYYESSEGVIRAEIESFRERSRNLNEYAYIVVPKGTATAVMNDRTPTERLLASIVKDAELTKSALQLYFKETRGHLSREISNFL
jgi:serine/threonine protein kinase